MCGHVTQSLQILTAHSWALKFELNQAQYSILECMLLSLVQYYPILMHFSTAMLVPYIGANNLMQFDSWRQTSLVSLQNHWTFERSLWRRLALNLDWVTLDLEPYCGPNPGILFTASAHVGDWILSRKLSVQIRSFENLKMPPKLEQFTIQSLEL